jgi:hypothetical protein
MLADDRPFVVTRWRTLATAPAGAAGGVRTPGGVVAASAKILLGESFPTQPGQPGGFNRAS